ncbi:MAG: MFS transporter [Nitrososphaerota archaeon]|nr:MFS transporter [Candidatus Bathyarchaeota archaeon]MDW8048153.1 MFS transporter [Nitrososphaerota archaeon]
MIFTPEEDDGGDQGLRPLYIRSILNSLGTGAIQPFLGPYAVMLGASSSDMGWYQSLTNLSTHVMQVFWGEMSDRLRRRIPFIFFGTLMTTVAWIPMIFANSVQQLIILIAIQYLLGSAATPAWTALIGDLVPPARLGRAAASISLWSSIGGLIATLFSGIIMVHVGGSIQNEFLIPFLIAIICGFASSIAMLQVKEKEDNIRTRIHNRGLFEDMLNIIIQAERNRDFFKYCMVNVVFAFFMSIAWPLFSITLIRVLNATMLEVSLLSVVQGIAIIIFQKWAGKLTDTLGRRPLLVAFRTGLFLVPLAYAFAPNVYCLIIFNFYLGLITSLGQASATAYILDISPEEYRGGFVAFFNLLYGIACFTGSLLGGYLSDVAVSIYGLVVGLQIVYIISSCGRFFGGLLFLSLNESLRK